MVQREHWRLAGEATSVQIARNHVASVIGHLPAEFVEAITVMVSELATNAVVHAGTPFDLDLRFDAGNAMVYIEVTDHGGGQPRRESPSADQPHGRGLQITAAFADAWGIEPLDAGPGKTVWFELRCNEPSLRHSTS